jgi:hypothetical protein
MERERWRIAKDYPNYEVSNLGRIRSVTTRKVLRGYLKRHPSGRVVTKIMTLTKDDVVHYVRLHQLVLRAFKGSCPDGMEGCHNDGNPDNNRIDNLRWDTHLNNMLDQIKHGTKTNPPKHAGDGHPNAKLTMDQVRHIQQYPIRRGDKALLAREYGVSQTHIARVIKGTARLEQQ